ncbi:MAG: hypothetical protein ABR543_11365 [Gemmatimonadaceae bacterium]
MVREPLLLAAILLTIGWSAPSSPVMCSIHTADGEPWRPSVDATRRVVREADVIVRARAVRADSVLGSNDRWYGAVGFKVLEIVDGDSPVASHMVFYGWLVGHDDFNPGAVPYPAVRPEGQRGACFAEAYRLNAEYLFLLHTRGQRLTPYWAALSPVNEQVRGPTDPWVVWVRAERRRASDL